MTLKKALQIFGLDDLSGVTKDDLKNIYKKLAKTKHPDSTGGDVDDFIELQEAFNTLVKYVHHPNGSNRDLASLTKEEILEKYFEDTKILQQKIDDFQSHFSQQSQIMDEIRQKIETLIADFEARKRKLRADLEREIAKLEHKYSENIFKKILFFLPKMTEEEFWEIYKEKVSKYSKKHLELDVDFLKEMLSVYGDGLNKINQSLKVNNKLD